MSSLTITLIGGPTALSEIDGFRLLTDPTFDAPGTYQLPHVKLEKLQGPALSAAVIGMRKPHPEERRLGRVSKDDAVGLMVRDGAKAPPHHGGSILAKHDRRHPSAHQRHEGGD